jgi:Asp-tRNA(Asn)/Glu-tRNA(Gln) amidotransferase A subunit family amidase
MKKTTQQHPVAAYKNSSRLRTHLPVGLQLVGRPRDEMGLLQLASAFEGETNFYKQRPGVVG